jgi:hypothetical protein
MSRVLAFKKATPRRRTHRAAGIVAGEFHPLGGHAVEIGCFDDFLPEAPEITIAEIIGEDEDDVGLPGGSGESENEED